MADVLDKRLVLARFGNDAQFLQEMVSLFLESSTGWLAEIRMALSREDALQVRKVAHTLKGSTGNFLARDAAAAALRLEETARSGDLSTAPEALAALEAEVKRLQEALAALVRDVLAEPTNP